MQLFNRLKYGKKVEDGDCGEEILRIKVVKVNCYVMQMKINYRYTQIKFKIQGTTTDYLSFSMEI